MNLNNIRFPFWSAPAALFLLALTTYGLLIPWLGFYWDDWPYLWIYHTLGTSAFPDFVASDRPFSAWIFILTTALFGESPLPYHLLALVLRWLTAVLFWAVLARLWPGQLRQVTWAAILFLVHPGFKQQPIALIYNHHLSVLVLFLFSLLAMLWSVENRPRRWLFTILSLAAAGSMFSLEYFVGLELIRPLLLWLKLGTDQPGIQRRLKRTGQEWLPYLILLGIYLYWRVAVFRFPSYEPSGVEKILVDPLAGLGALAQTIAADLVDVLFRAWIHGLRLPTGVTSGAILLLILAAGVVFVIFYLMHFSTRAPSSSWRRLLPAVRTKLKFHLPWRVASPSSTAWAIQALAVGSAALLVAGIPAWATDLPVHLVYPYDRMALPFILGACLVLAALIELFIRPHIPQLLVLAGLVALALTLHFQNANTYRVDLERFQDFFWQMAWRAPGLERGTIVVTHEEPFLYYSDNSLTAPLNWIYAPGVNNNNRSNQEEISEELPFVFFNVEVRLGRALPGLEPGLEVTQEYRSQVFRGSTSDILVVTYKPPGCVHVIDPDLHGIPPGISEDLAAAVPLSNPGQIIVQPAVPAVPPANLFGPEPKDTWCYYYQKAELARQSGDWQQVTNLGNAAFLLEDDPNAWPEYLVFLEGYAYMREWQQAQGLSEILNQVPELRAQSCDIWKRIEQNMQLNPDEQQQVTEVKTLLECE